MVDQSIIQIDWSWTSLLLLSVFFGFSGGIFREKLENVIGWISVLLQLLWLGWASYHLFLGTESRALFHFESIHNWLLDLDVKKLWTLCGLSFLAALSLVRELLVKNNDPIIVKVRLTGVIFSGVVLGIFSTSPWPALCGWVLTSAGVVLGLSDGLFSGRPAQLKRSWFFLWILGTLLIATGLVFQEIQKEETGRIVLLVGMISLFMNFPTFESDSRLGFDRIWYRFFMWVSLALLGTATHAVWNNAFVIFHWDFVLSFCVLLLSITTLRWFKLDFGFCSVLGLFGLWQLFQQSSLSGALLSQAQQGGFVLVYLLIIAGSLPSWAQYIILSISSFATFCIWNPGLDQGFHFWNDIYSSQVVGQILFYLNIFLISVFTWVSVLHQKKTEQSKLEATHLAVAIPALIALANANPSWSGGETIRAVVVLFGGVAGVVMSRQMFWVTPPALVWMHSLDRRVQPASETIHKWLGESYERLGVKFSRKVDELLVEPISKFVQLKASRWSEFLMLKIETAISKALRLSGVWKVKSTRTQILISWLITLLISLIVILE